MLLFQIVASLTSSRNMMTCVLLEQTAAQVQASLTTEIVQLATSRCLLRAQRRYGNSGCLQKSSRCAQTQHEENVFSVILYMSGLKQQKNKREHLAKELCPQPRSCLAKCVFLMCMHDEKSAKYVAFVFRSFSMVQKLSAFS
jgi:hypothetical protein